MDKKIPSSDMRGMFYENSTKPYYFVKKGSLCDKCGGLDNCQTDDKRKGAFSEIQSCNTFIPIISFAPPFGNMKDEFNTMRLGKAWLGRSAPGCRVAIQHTKTKEIIGHAEVIRIVAGELNEVAEQHAEENHMLLDEEVENAGEEIKKILRRCYGKLFYNSASNLTAIYLRRVEEKSVWHIQQERLKNTPSNT